MKARQKIDRSEPTPFPEGLAKPALRTLANSGFDHLEQLASVPEEEVRACTESVQTP